MQWRITIYVPNRRDPDRPLRDLRREWIAETNAFLAWAFTPGRKLPRIPIRAVSRGGFQHILRIESGKVLIYKWWHKVLETTGVE